MTKVLDEELVAAVNEWRGRVTDVARVLDLSRTTVYERLDQLGLGTHELDVLRRGQGVAVLVDGVAGIWPVSSSDASVNPVNRAVGVHTVRVTSEGERPTLPIVQTETKDAPIPVAPARTKTKHPRLRPSNVDAFGSGVIDLVATFRKQFDDDEVFNQFFQESWGPWIAAKTGTTK